MNFSIEHVLFVNYMHATEIETKGTIVIIKNGCTRKLAV
jgi:hypothetical protein